MLPLQSLTPMFLNQRREGFYLRDPCNPCPLLRLLASVGIFKGALKELGAQIPMKLNGSRVLNSLWKSQSRGDGGERFDVDSWLVGTGVRTTHSTQAPQPPWNMNNFWSPPTCDRFRPVLWRWEGLVLMSHPLSPPMTPGLWRMLIALNAKQGIG